MYIGKFTDLFSICWNQATKKKSLNSLLTNPLNKVDFKIKRMNTSNIGVTCTVPHVFCHQASDMAAFVQAKRDMGCKASQVTVLEEGINTDTRWAKEFWTLLGGQTPYRGSYTYTRNRIKYIYIYTIITQKYNKNNTLYSLFILFLHIFLLNLLGVFQMFGCPSKLFHKETNLTIRHLCFAFFVKIALPLGSYLLFTVVTSFGNSNKNDLTHYLSPF